MAIYGKVVTNYKKNNALVDNQALGVYLIHEIQLTYQKNKQKKKNQDDSKFSIDPLHIPTCFVYTVMLQNVWRTCVMQATPSCLVVYTLCTLYAHQRYH